MRSVDTEESNKVWNAWTWTESVSLTINFAQYVHIYVQIDFAIVRHSRQRAISNTEYE